MFLFCCLIKLFLFRANKILETCYIFYLLKFSYEYIYIFIFYEFYICISLFIYSLIYKSSYVRCWQFLYLLFIITVILLRHVRVIEYVLLIKSFKTCDFLTELGEITILLFLSILSIGFNFLIQFNIITIHSELT